jgi:hypothetical protein
MEHSGRMTHLVGVLAMNARMMAGGILDDFRPIQTLAA